MIFMLKGADDDIQDYFELIEAVNLNAAKKKVLKLLEAYFGNGPMTFRKPKDHDLWHHVPYYFVELKWALEWDPQGFVKKYQSKTYEVYETDN